MHEGLDLKGGMRVILEADTDQIKQRKLNVTVDQETMQRVRAILESRVNEFGLSGATVQLKGENQIVAVLPGARNPEQALSQLQRVAQMEFRWLKDVQTEEIRSRRYKMSHIPGGPNSPDSFQNGSSGRSWKAQESSSGTISRVVSRDMAKGRPAAP